MVVVVTIKRQGRMASQLRSSRQANNLVSSATFMNYFFSVGKREMCPKVCEMLTSLRFTKIKVNAVTAIIIEAYPY